MKKSAILLFICCFAYPSFAQTGKIIKPILQATAAKTAADATTRNLTLQQAERAYLAAARNYKRFTPPLISSDYALKVGQAWKYRNSSASGAISQKLTRFVYQRVAALERLKNEKQAALLNYGRVLAQNHGWLSTHNNTPSPLPDLFAHSMHAPQGELPFKKYIYAVTKNIPSKKLDKMPLEQRAIFLFLQEDLTRTANEFFAKLKHPDPFGDATSLSFSTANRLIQLTQFMLRYPNDFQPQLFELNVLAAQSSKTPFNDYLRNILQKDPNYLTYRKWLQAENTGRNSLSFDKMYAILAGQ